MARRLALIALIGLVLAPAPAPSEPWKYTPPTAPKAPTAEALLGRLALLTAATAAIGLFCIWLARRSQKLPAGTGNEPMKLVGRVALGPRCALHILEVDDSKFVIGSDATGIKHILPLPETFRLNENSEGERGQS